MGHGRVCRGICAAQFGKWLRKSEVRGGWKRLHSLSSRLRRRRCPCPGRRWGSQSWRADLEDPGRARVAGPEGRHLRTARLEAHTSYSQFPRASAPLALACFGRKFGFSLVKQVPPPLLSLPPPQSIWLCKVRVTLSLLQSCSRLNVKQAECNLLSGRHMLRGSAVTTP